MFKKTMILGFILGAAIVLSGCVSMDLKYTRTTTIGQELLDLQKAKEAGLLTDEEFCNKKKQVLAEEIKFKAEKHTTCQKCSSKLDESKKGIKTCTIGFKANSPAKNQSPCSSSCEK